MNPSTLAGLALRASGVRLSLSYWPQCFSSVSSSSENRSHLFTPAHALAGAEGVATSTRGVSRTHTHKTTQRPSKAKKLLRGATRNGEKPIQTHRHTATYTQGSKRTNTHAHMHSHKHIFAKNNAQQQLPTTTNLRFTCINVTSPEPSG